MSARSTTAAVAIVSLGGIALLLLPGRSSRNHDADVVPLADAAPAKLSEAIAVAPVDETESLKSQLADKQLAPQVRAAAAVRVKWLAGQGRADLVGAQLDDAALDDAYFFSANFTNASLKAAKLSGVNFFAATLINADLSDAELVDADLRGVNAIGANLMRADLTRAILFGADLSDARLDGANLQAARLQGANLITAQLVGADLRGALFSTQQGGGYPTRFPQGFQPKQHGMIECPGAHECAFSVPDPGPRADGSWEP